MKKQINPDDFQSYRIVGNGWTLTVYTLREALWQFNDLHTVGQLIGTRHDGRETILKIK